MTGLDHIAALCRRCGPMCWCVHISDVWTWSVEYLLVDLSMLNILWMFFFCRPKWERAECTNACSTINLRKQCQKRCGTSIVIDVMGIKRMIMQCKHKFYGNISSFLFCFSTSSVQQFVHKMSVWEGSVWTEVIVKKNPQECWWSVQCMSLSCLSVCVLNKHLCPQCRNALTTRQKLIAQDYKVSYSLAKACKADLRKYRCNPDTSMPRAREARLSYLLLCLESAVHRGLLIYSFLPKLRIWL